MQQNFNINDGYTSPFNIHHLIKKQNIIYFHTNFDRINKEIINCDYYWASKQYCGRRSNFT